MLRRRFEILIFLNLVFIGINFYLAKRVFDYYQNIHLEKKVIVIKEGNDIHNFLKDIMEIAYPYAQVKQINKRQALAQGTLTKDFNLFFKNTWKIHYMLYPRLYKLCIGSDCKPEKILLGY